MGDRDEHDDGLHSKEGPKANFVPSHGITTAEADALRLQWGKNELEEKTTPSWLIFVRQLYQPMPIMIWIAAIVEAVIMNWADFGILMGIQFLNATLGWYETTKAGDAVAALKASLKPTATVKRDGKWQTMDASLLVPGDMVLLAAGSAIPADCLVNHGQIDVDQSALTGESLPVTMYAGESAKMGSTVTRGEVEGTVEFTGKNTFFGKTATMLQGDNEMGHLQKILLTIMFVLVAMSFVLCFTAFGYLLGMGAKVREALSFTVVLLVASIPIAIEIVCTTTLALGSRQLSGMGAIVTRLAAIEDMAGMNMLCSDKTGTLTLNKMVIQDETPTFVPNMDQKELLRMAALAAKWKEPARDALDTLVLSCADLPSLDVFQQIDFMPFDPTVKRTEGTLKGEDGKVFKCTKGAPHIILKLLDQEADAQVIHAAERQVQSFGQRGIRCLAVARQLDGDRWRLLGLLTFLDPPRPDTKATIHKAMEYGVDVKMITGDHVLIAKETARMLGMNTNIKDAKGLPSMDADGKIPKDLGKNFGELILDADGFGQVYPEHKYLIVEALRQCGFAVGMTGDGVNDAPALKRADVGVAVQGSTDAARAAADIVLTQPGLTTVVEAIVIARCIFQRMKNFINYRISATLQLLVFFFIAVLSLHPIKYAEEHVCPHFYMAGKNATDPKWTFQTEIDSGEWDVDNTYFLAYQDADGVRVEPNRSGSLYYNCMVPGELKRWPEFFFMPVLMLMLITLLNDGTLISVGYDSVKPSHYPEKWNLPALFFISGILGGIACLSSLILLWAALDSWNKDGIFHKWHIGRMTYGKVTTMVYLKVSISDFLTLFSARTHEGFFWSARPSFILLGACATALSISTILACVWPEGKTDHIRTEGLARKTKLTQAVMHVVGGVPQVVDVNTGLPGPGAEPLTINYDYSLMPLWIWLYCVIWWFIQDACKVVAYHFMHKYNAFNINTDKIINVRAARSANDPKVPLARHSVGLVENKLLAAKVEGAIQKVEDMARTSKGPNAAGLQRVSQSLALMRTSIKASRVSVGAEKAGHAKADAERGAAQLEAQVQELEKAVAAAPAEMRGEIQVQLDSVRATAAQLSRVEQAVATGKDTGANK